MLWKLENNFFIEYWAVEIQHFDNKKMDRISTFLNIEPVEISSKDCQKL